MKVVGAWAVKLVYPSDHEGFCFTRTYRTVGSVVGGDNSGPGDIRLLDSSSLDLDGGGLGHS